MAPLVSRETVVLSFQLHDFVETGHQYSSVVDEISLFIISLLVKDNFRPPRQPRHTSARENRQRSRSSSLEPVSLLDVDEFEPSWPSNWAVDRSLVRAAAVKFQQGTSVTRQRLLEPPSVPTSPSSSRPTTPSGTSGPDTSRGTSQSAEESIFNKPIGPERPHPDLTMAGINDPAIQRIIQEAVNAGIQQYQAAHPAAPGPPGPPGPAGAQGPAGNDGNGNSTARWNPGDVGFFDPLHDGKSVASGASSMEHTGKDTFFRDVHLFLEHARDVAGVKGDDLVRTNLWTCLKGTALSWWLGELSENDKRLAKLGTKLDEWERMLITRFKQPTNVAIDQALRERYTLRDASNHREPREYAQKILRSAKDANLTTVGNHLDIIYNGLDSELRRDIRRPKADTTLEEFLGTLDDAKYDWWTYASRGNRSSGGNSSAVPRPSRNERPAGNGQYMPRQGFQSSGYQPNFQRQPYYPNFSNFQNNAYSNQYGRPGQYQGRPYQQAENQPSNAPRLPAPQERRQITAAHGNPEPSGSPFRRNDNAANQGRQNWQPKQAWQNRGQQMPLRPKVYHGEADENQEPADFDDEHDQHRGAYHGEHEDSDFEEHGDAQGFEQGDALDDFTQHPEIHFTNPISTTFPCRQCSGTFTSKNDLFRHLRSEWTNPVKHVITSEEALPKELESAYSGVPEETTRTVIRSSRSPSTARPGYAFRGFHYVTLSIAIAAEYLRVCADTGCSMTLIDRTLLRRLLPELNPSKLSSPISVRGLGDAMHKTSEYVNISVAIDGKLRGKAVTAQLTLEAHIVDNLRANMLLGNDVIVPEKMCLDPANQRMTIGSCQGMVTEITAVAKSTPVHRTIRAKGTVTIPAMSTASVPVSYQGDTLPTDRDFLFEPQYKGDLGFDGGVFAHVVDSSISFVQLRNATDKPAQISRRTRLGNIVEYNQAGAYLVSPEDASLAAGGWLTRKPRQSWKSRVARGIAAMATAVAMTGTSSSSPSVDTSMIPEVSRIGTSSSSAVTIDPSLEHVMPNGITVYGTRADAVEIASVADEFPEIWTDNGQTVDIPEEEWMPIPLKADADPKPCRVYPLGQKDREVVDETFDKMHQQGKMTWSNQPTKFSYPVFVVWRDMPNGKRKGRVVVDIRGLNKVTESDSYPMPLQSEVINTVAGYRYISTVDAMGYFHQFLVQVADRHKLTVVSHRGQEQSNVALMGYKGSPPYVQRQTDKLLRPLQGFAKAYVDDMITYSKTLEEHIDHLRRLFRLCREKRITLSPTKSFLGYPSVMLLGQRVDSLGMSTSAEKIRAIQALIFPANLRDLEIYLGLTGWLRSSIHRYAQIAQPLQDRKTALTKDLPTKAGIKAKGIARKRQSMQAAIQQPSEEEIQSYENLQKAFANPVFLIHYDQTRRMYIDLDASKRWGFAAMIYHVKGDPALDASFARTSVQPIMFLSKLLNGAEKNYWPTELEVAGIVWVVKKIRHLIESSQVPPVVIYTDHSAAVPISKQTTLTTSSTDKLNLRLVRASQYLSSFNITIRHKAGKSNVVPDALSRLPGSEQMPKDQEGVLDVLYGHAPTEELDKVPSLPDLVEDAYHITLVEMSDDFKTRLRYAYEHDDAWKRIITMLRKPTATIPPVADSDAQNLPEASETTVDRTAEFEKPGVRFKQRDELLYYTGGDGHERLCIPESLESEVFKMAHDMSNHGGFHRTYDRLVNSVFIRHLAKRLRAYITHCPDCQVFQTTRHATYGSLTPVMTPAIPFHTVAMDFVIELPESDGFNTMLTITDKFTKKVILEPGRDTWKADDWANVVIVALFKRDWGVPRAFISDRDSKFMSSFWKAVFGKLGVDMLTSTAYHPQTDGQSERTNQSIEIALRFYLSANPDSNWVEGLPFLSAVHNNSTNSTTGLAPNEIAYGFRVNDNLSLLQDLPAEDFSRLRQVKRDAADEAIAFANTVTKARYDKKHVALNLQEGAAVYLKLHHGYRIPGLVNRKLSQQRVGPFKILQKVGNLAYRLELPPTVKIHPVVSVAQLEPLPPKPDPYNRARPDAGNPPAVENEDSEAPSFEIERLLDRRIAGRGNKLEYLVKWKGYGHEWNWWYKIKDLGAAQTLVDEYDTRHPYVDRPRRGRRGGQQAPSQSRLQAVVVHEQRGR